MYKDRIGEIDNQIKIEIRKKHWGMKANLEKEKAELQIAIKSMEDKK